MLRNLNASRQLTQQKRTETNDKKNRDDRAKSRQSVLLPAKYSEHAKQHDRAGRGQRAGVPGKRPASRGEVNRGIEEPREV